VKVAVPKQTAGASTSVRRRRAVDDDSSDDEAGEVQTSTRPSTGSRNADHSSSSGSAAVASNQGSTMAEPVDALIGMQSKRARKPAAVLNVTPAEWTRLKNKTAATPQNGPRALLNQARTAVGVDGGRGSSSAVPQVNQQPVHRPSPVDTKKTTATSSEVEVKVPDTARRNVDGAVTNAAASSIEAPAEAPDFPTPSLRRSIGLPQTQLPAGPVTPVTTSDPAASRMSLLSPSCFVLPVATARKTPSVVPAVSSNRSSGAASGSADKISSPVKSESTVKFGSVAMLSDVGKSDSTVKPSSTVRSGKSGGAHMSDSAEQSVSAGNLSSPRKVTSTGKSGKSVKPGRTPKSGNPVKRLKKPAPGPRYPLRSSPSPVSSFSSEVTSPTSLPASVHSSSPHTAEHVMGHADGAVASEDDGGKVRTRPSTSTEEAVAVDTPAASLGHRAFKLARALLNLF